MKLSNFYQYSLVTCIIAMIFFLVLFVFDMIFFFSLDQSYLLTNYGINLTLIERMSNMILETHAPNFLVFLVASLPILLFFLIDYKLVNFFLNLRKNKVFNQSNIRILKSVALFIFVWVLLDVLLEPLLSYCFSLNLPDGKRVISLSFLPSHFFAVFLSIATYCFAKILLKGNEIQEENDGFI